MRLNKKIKKADMMPEESLKILLGVLGIVLLFYLAFSLYGIFLDKTKVEQARVVLEDIAGKASVLNFSEATSYLIVSPKDWTLYLFNTTQIAPKGCKNAFCLCACSAFSNIVKDQAKLCDENGLCKVFVTPIYSKSTEGNYFRLRTLPRVLYLQNINGAVFISGSSDASAQATIDLITSSSTMKKLIEDIFITHNKTEIESTKTTVNSKMKGEDWDLKIFKNLGSAKELVQIQSDNIDLMYLSIMLQYSPTKGSFTENNTVYNLEMRSSQHE